MTTPEQRRRMAAAIVNFEARRDSKRHLMVYKLPKGDGGGRYEVAGINERYNKDTVDVPRAKNETLHRWSTMAGARRRRE